jgi:hypothetical protein
MSSTKLGVGEARSDYDVVDLPAPRARRPRDTAYQPRSPRAYQSDRTRIDENGVRTVRIRGQATPARRRPAIQIDRYDRAPDRAAQWALFMGVFMVVVAIVTGS